MTFPWRRLLVLLVALPLIELAAGAVASVVVVDSTITACVAAGVGLALGALWVGSGSSLTLTTAGLSAVLVAFRILDSSSQHLPRAATPLGLQSVQAQQHVTMIGLAVAVAALYLATTSGWLLSRARAPWPVVALVGSSLLLRADVAKIYEDRFPLVIAGCIILVACAYAPDLRGAWLALPAAILAGVVILAAWQLPVASAAWLPGWADPISSIESIGSGSGSGPTSLSLLGAFHPTNQPVMTVTLDRYNLQPYWQTVIFDRYDGHSWSISASRETPLASPASFGAAPANQLPVTAIVHLSTAVQDLVAPGTLASTDIPATALYSPHDMEPLEVRSTGILATGATYLVTALLTPPPISSVSELQPYLQLPAEPARLHALASRLTSGKPDALARMLAIESYLRNSGLFHYDVRTGSPPGVDAVQEFLFHSHRGYCNQFASSMVVLAREAGIPARLIAGYDTGTLIPGSNSTFLIRQRNAHSWVQAYVPGDGWVLADPTPGFAAGPTLPPRPPAHHRSSSRAPTSRRNSLPKHNGAGWGRRSLPQPRLHIFSTPNQHQHGAPVTVLIWSAAFLLFGAAGITFVRRPRTVSQYYASAVAATPRRYGRMHPDETPAEFVERLRGLSVHADYLLLANLYTRQRYSGWTTSKTDVRLARRAWARLRRTWLIGAFRHIDSLPRA